MPAVAIVLLLLLIFAAASVRIIMEYEIGLVYTFGKYSYGMKPGLKILIPFIQQMRKIDMRVMTEDIPPQDVISKDNVSVQVNAVVYYKVVNPDFAVNRVEDYRYATSQLAQTTLRAVLGKHELDEMLEEREKLNNHIQEILDTQTDGWGVKVVNVEIKNVDIDPNMQRMIAKQAEAERIRRSKIIVAQAEFEAAQKLDEAAEILGRRPESMQLRYLGSLGEFVNSKGSTIVLPLPMDVLQSGLEALGKAKKAA